MRACTLSHEQGETTDTQRGPNTPRARWQTKVRVNTYPRFHKDGVHFVRGERALQLLAIQKLLLNHIKRLRKEYTQHSQDSRGSARTQATMPRLTGKKRYEENCVALAKAHDDKHNYTLRVKKEQMYQGTGGKRTRAGAQAVSGMPA